MRVVVGTEGRVTDLQRLPGILAASTQHYGLFEAAIRDAVSSWDFSPARIIESQVDPNTGLGEVQEQLIEMSFDVEFVFEQTGEAEL